MSRTVKEYMDFVKNVRDNIPRQVGGIIERNEQLILDLNRKLQLYDKGENIFGAVVGVYKSDHEPSLFSDPDGYPKRAGEPYNFFDTSDLYRNFSYSLKDNKLVIFSEDSKSPMLVRQYGELFGLNSENQITLNQEIIKPKLWDYIASYL